MPLGEPFLPQPSAELLQLEMGIQKTSELPHIIPPLPTGDTKDLKVWKEYWMQHDAYIRKDEREKVPDILICPCPPNANGFCTIPQNCIAKRMRDQDDCDIVCKAMQSLRQSKDGE